MDLMNVRIKICGVKRVEDAHAAARAGAHAIGLNFVPASPRFIGDVKRAQELIAACGPTSLLWAGIFANPSDAEIDAAIAACIRVIQLHGEETPELAARLRARLDPPIQIWKAFRIAQAGDLQGLSSYSACDAFVLDTKADGVRGGSGQSFDWGLLDGLTRTKPIILAGGLNPGNVREAVRRVRPEWVDVASGVESAPGVKEAALIDRFIREARAAF